MSMRNATIEASSAVSPAADEPSLAKVSSADWLYQALLFECPEIGRNGIMLTTLQSSAVFTSVSFYRMLFFLLATRNA
jgi:hypothetical protein